MNNTEHTTFDEHIEYLQSMIENSQGIINECNENIKDYEKQIRKIKKEKIDFFKNSTYRPSINLDGLKEEDKKIPITQWAKKHELEFHKELVGNYYKELHKVSEYKRPLYSFITSTSDTSVIRYVVCIDCYNRFIKNNEPTDNAILLLR